MRMRWMFPLLLPACFTTTSDRPPPEVPDEDVAEQKGACTALEGKRFESLDEHECGLTPDGVATCHWQITIEAREPTSSDFQWHYSDVVESGTIRCDGTAIELLQGAHMPGPIGVYDPAKAELRWDALVYIHGS